MNDSVRCDRVVMIVEDDPDVRQILDALVSDEGFGTVTAANGRDALDCLATLKGATLPCVILLDMMMPIVDGWQFRAAQQRDPQLAAIPVVVLSAHEDAGVAAAQMACAGYLKKPVDFTRLLTLIRDHC